MLCQLERASSSPVLHKRDFRLRETGSTHEVTERGGGGAGALMEASWAPSSHAAFSCCLAVLNSFSFSNLKEADKITLGLPD